ncbi:MAG: hypothetical protein IIA34_04410 [Proteobacteria bacterium]|nr:hypothetical protein [Pseudomonadota bacterium]
MVWLHRGVGQSLGMFPPWSTAVRTHISMGEGWTMAGMWKHWAGLMLLLATACATGERPGAVLRRDFPAVAIQRLGAHEYFYADYGDRAVLYALHRTMQAGVPKDKIEKVVLTAFYGPPISFFREPDSRPDAYDLWLRIADCDRLVYMKANFNGRVVAVQDKGGCLKPAAGSSLQ